MLTLEQEQEIVKAILAGDKEQYAIIVKAYQTHVTNLCYHLAGDKLDAEEIVQQVFVELYTSLPRFRHESKLSTYIYRITVHVVATALQHEKKHLPYDKTIVDEGVDTQLSREEQMEQEEQYRQLHVAIGQLKTEQRTALVLSVFKGLSYVEIAEVMQVSLSKVESLIFRAKKNIVKIMTENNAEKKRRHRATI